MTDMRVSRRSNDCNFVHVSLGGAGFGIALGNVKELVICRGLSIVQGTPAFVDGFVRVRNLSVPVIDLRRRFSLGRESGPLTRILIADVGGSIAGFVIDRIVDITGGLKAAPEPYGGCALQGCVDSAIKTSKGNVPIINLSLLLSEEEKDYLKAPVSVMTCAQPV